MLLARVNVGAQVAPPHEGFVAEHREGFAKVRKRTWVWAVIASAAFWNVMVAFTVLGPVVAKRLRAGGWTGCQGSGTEPQARGRERQRP